jgi:hypothetical protein
MKKNLLLLLILAAYSFKAQITFEKTYPNATSQKDYLRLVKLSNAGYKYVTTNTTSINLYNLTIRFT